MDTILVAFIIFDLIILIVIYRFMSKKLRNKLEQVEERQRARWARDEEMLRNAFEEE